jgi:hypothetical protein
MPTHIIEDNQRSVDASDGIVAESGLDGGHPGVNKVGHGESDPPRAKFRVEKGKDGGREQRWDWGGWSSCLDGELGR